MSQHMVRGRTVATAATADHAVCALWNAHSTARLTIYEIWLCANAAPAASAGFYARRITARGTAGSTVTPGIQHETGRRIATPAGVLLDLAAYSAQPTFETGGMFGWTLGAVAGSGIIIPLPRGIEVEPGDGFALVTTQAVAIPASDVTFLWEE